MRLWRNRSRSKMHTLETGPWSVHGPQLTQLLLGGILCMTIASNTQTSAEATAAQGTGAASAATAIIFDGSSDPSSASASASSSYSATAFSSLAQVSSLLPEAAALSATATLVEPYLDGYATSNVTTQIGTHAYLPCRVKQLGNKSVSWIRLRDGHILTVDRAVFIADQRFLAIKQPDKYWTLQIKYVQARDAGSYECQVSTEPKVSARVQLQVVVPRTEILGEPDRYVKAGSNVVLRCIVRGALEPPTFIMWYHGAEQLAADSRRHRTQLDPNLPEATGEGQSTIGSLIIESAKKRDTGNYTCSPSNSPSATVTLNIINGESSASAVTSSAATTRAYALSILALLLSVILIGVGHRT
ncbi:hemicentin-2 [Drosophila guanche]|uniref:Blast:Limbic system-associated membrane protein n=1 Tax=Drosophila guanche TaxID=7266 RepID=A0A3B0JPU6_DROGU|nr:hemicentin-2 [Drosophila guanche]SPP84224.1 blast:Limbic system-associated membrane protein [Drosophila guanche]